MNEMRHVKYFLATLMVASLATFGCGSKDDKSSGSVGKPSADATAAFGLFAKSSNMVFGVNMAQITSSSVYKKYKPMLDQQMGAQGGLEEFKSDCGIDPMTEFKTIIVGAEAGDDMEPKEETMLVVVKGPARAKMVACGKKMAEKKGGSVTEEGAFTKVVEETDGDVTWVGWLDDTTMVMAPKMGKPALETRMKGKDGLDTNTEMMALIGNTDQTAGVWFAVAPAGGIKPPPGNPLPPANFKAGFGSVNLKSGVRLDMGARTGSADEASGLKKELDGKIKELKPMADMMGAGKFVDKLKLSTNGADLLVKISLSNGDIDELSKLAQGAM